MHEMGTRKVGRGCDGHRRTTSAMGHHCTLSGNRGSKFKRHVTRTLRAAVGEPRPILAAAFSPNPRCPCLDKKNFFFSERGGRKSFPSHSCCGVPLAVLQPRRRAFLLLLLFPGSGSRWRMDGGRGRGGRGAFWRRMLDAAFAW